MGCFISWPDWGTKRDLHILFFSSEKSVAGDFFGGGSFFLLNAWRELGIEECEYIDIKEDVPYFLLPVSDLLNTG